MTSATLAADGAGPSNGDAAHTTLAPPQARTLLPAPPFAPSGLAPLARVSPITRLLDMPSFALAAFFLYWSVPLGVLMGYIRPWAGKKRRDDALGWCVFWRGAARERERERESVGARSGLGLSPASAPPPRLTHSPFLLVQGRHPPTPDGHPHDDPARPHPVHGRAGGVPGEWERKR